MRNALAGPGDANNDGFSDLVYWDNWQNTARIYSLNSAGGVASELILDESTGAPPGWYARRFGEAGDIDSDGIADFLSGDPTYDGVAGIDSGRIWVHFLNPDLTIRESREISPRGVGGFNGEIDGYDRFGNSLEGVGDMDGDGIPDIAVGSTAGENPGGHKSDGYALSLGSYPDSTETGEFWILLLNADGTVRREEKINGVYGNIPNLYGRAEFGYSLGALGDLDGNGIPDIAAGARTYQIEPGSTDRPGAVWNIFFESVVDPSPSPSPSPRPSPSPTVTPSPTPSPSPCDVRIHLTDADMPHSPGMVTSGDHTDTHDSDDQYQRLTESIGAGGGLSHVWAITAGPHERNRVRIEAFHAGGDGESFRLYASDWSQGGPWTYVGPIEDTADTDVAREFDLPTGRFTLYLRVTDANPGGEDSLADELWIDQLDILSGSSLCEGAIVPTPTPAMTPSPAMTPTPTPRPCCRGDADNSGGFVDSQDFVGVQINFGNLCGPGDPGDADCSGGFVDSSDFVGVQDHFGDMCEV